MTEMHSQSQGQNKRPLRPLNSQRIMNFAFLFIKVYICYGFVLSELFTSLDIVQLFFLLNMNTNFGRYKKSHYLSTLILCKVYTYDNK